MTFREWFSNRPRPIRDLFSRGDECSQCSAPAGQLEMGGVDCQNGNCLGGMTGVNPVDVGYYPADMPPASANSINNRIRTGYAPAGSAGEFGSGVRSMNSNAELELPPMYGK